MESKKPIILIFDSNALVYRAYHALPRLTSPQGVLVSAVFGFMSAFLTALNVFKPRYCVAVFDVAGKTFRHRKFKDYKAQRIKPPQEMYDQIPVIQNLLKELNVPVIGKAGYEADDVIGALCQKLNRRHPDKEIIIVTGDKDVYQLINQKVSVSRLQKGFSQLELVRVKDVQKEYGFSPKQMVDFKALAGDSADNIPGVAGIGVKSASRLISRYGSLINLYCQLDADKVEAPARQIKLLNQQRQQAFACRELAEIDTNVKIDFNLDSAVTNDFDFGLVRQALEDLGFKSLIKRLPASNRLSLGQSQLF